jgi:hypothetical protein
MGTDDLFHKRKARSAVSLNRKKARRDPYSKVLIVCEGEKTEPNYFHGLRDYYGLNTANVEVCGDCGSSPISVFNYARQRYREERDLGDAFDKVFCVFDKDSHSSYQEAIVRIKSATPKGVFHAVPSVPCFEYWLLLHYNYLTKPYCPLSGNSPCSQVIKDLKTYLPDYAKGQQGLFNQLIGQLEFAKKMAQRSLDQANQNGTDNPTTLIHELVVFLQNIKN